MKIHEGRFANPRSINHQAYHDATAGHSGVCRPDPGYSNQFGKGQGDGASAGHAFDTGDGGTYSFASSLHDFGSGCGHGDKNGRGDSR